MGSEQHGHHHGHDHGGQHHDHVHDHTGEHAHGHGGRGALATLLGLGSLGLGAAQLAAPERVARFAGLAPTGAVPTVMRVMGAREIVQGLGILRGNPNGWLWSRVLGDVGDIAALTAGAGRRGNDEDRVRVTTGALTGVLLVDLVAALRSPGGGPADDAITVRAAATVRKPPDEVYGFWRDFTQLPQFMAHLQSVEVRDARRSHWVANSPFGGTVDWDAEIVDDIPGELIAWRSVEGARVPNWGAVEFTRAPGDRGTEVRVELHVDPPAGKLGRAVAGMLGEDPSQQVHDDLRRFKQVLETGEVVRSQGSPHGPLSRSQLKQRPAQPVHA